MIGAPLDPIRRRRKEALGLMWGMSLALFLPILLGMLLQKTHRHASTWMAAYEPVVYFQATATEIQMDTFARELETWPGVRQVQRRSSQEALARVEAEFGQEAVRELGLGASMMPQSVRVLPQVPFHGHLELAAAVEALQSRDAVVLGVDVPTGRAQGVMELVRASAVGVGVVLLMLWVVAGMQLGSFLRQMQLSRWAELSLLEQFGAPARGLRAPMVAQALALGTGAGVMATLMLCVVQWGLGRWDQVFGDGGVTMSWMALMVGLPLAAGPLLGLVVGRFAGTGRPRPSALKQTESLLRFDPNTLHLA